MKLSVAIATLNEEQKLGECLASVGAWVDEIVLVDGGSSDRTLEIAKKYQARIIRTDNPPIFHINKQKALDACRGDWILQLDADEVVTPELRDEILSVIPASELASRSLRRSGPGPNEKKDWIPGQARNDNICSGYYISRKNYFCGHWLHKGGQYPDLLIRLVRRGKARFPCKSVHEQIEVTGQLGNLANPLLHYPYMTIGEYWKKANAYIALTAEDMRVSHVPITPLSWFLYNAVKPTVTFFLLYVRHKGMLDGVWGFLFALFSALHHPLAYMRYVKNDRRS
ncbi:glycosyltransferase family 2 protein [Candidatus Gottesmanbacteria bacterium]|nr:glycosyltransferase family 2 protein [Candidatus Gottesmanbacteria bacterium]